MIAGCSIRLSTPPSDSASANSSQRSSMRLAFFSPPLTSMVMMPPKPSIWRLARACCGWLFSPG